eukprot:3498947-Pleurochrysis_carterae.AAC.3
MIPVPCAVWVVASITRTGIIRGGYPSRSLSTRPGASGRSERVVASDDFRHFQRNRRCINRTR